MSNQEKVNSLDELLGMTHVKQDDEVQRLICRASWEFKGQITHLYTAVGALVVGRLFGWRILRLTLDAKEYAMCQRILAVGLDDPGEFKFNQWMREREKLAYKSIGLALVDTVGDFWAACKGRISQLPLAKRRDISS